MAFKFPFTNYHELNLTWVLDQLKALFEKSEENVTVIENYNGRLTAVETELPLVADTAQGAAQQAAAAATLAQHAKSTADTAQENAIQAQGLAGTARQEAQQAQAAADAATQAAQQAQATAQNFDGRITQAENNASEALEASRSFENRVQSAITTANNAAQTATNAQGIATRADQNAALALDTLNAQRSELERIGAEQVERITEETESGKTEIETLAQSVLDSIPSDYTALSNLVDKKAPVIINSASGAAASFNDGADNMKIQKLVVNIEPAQAGSGDPSPDNVRPISGWTGAAIEQTGKNLLRLNDFVQREGYSNLVQSFEDGTITVTNVSGGGRFACWNIPVIVGKRYMISFGELINCGAVYVNTSDNKPTAWLGYGISIQNRHPCIPDKKWIQITVDWNQVAGTTFFSIKDLQIEVGNSFTSYESPVSSSISVTFPETIYGGSVTLNPDGSADVVSAMGNIGSYAGETLPGAWISSMDVYEEGATPTTGAQVVYELAEPVSYHFDDVGQLKTFLGTNNIWADAGPVSVDYPADTKLYIDGKLAELQATILENI